MIFCDKHKLLVIKNMKVGSTSLEVELSQILPSTATVTIINPPNKNHKPRNLNGFVNHSSFLDVSKRIDLTNTVSYTIVRHPFEMVASDFFFRSEVISAGDWNQLEQNTKIQLVDMYFKNKFSNGGWFKSTKNLYTIDNNIAVDNLLRYENGIANEMNKFLPNHNLPQIPGNTYEKAYRPKNVSYHDIFDKEKLSLIADEWHWEFNNLGYIPYGI